MRRQSEHLADYAAALSRLTDAGLVYPCFCTRGDIAAAGGAPHGDEHGRYPGTCRRLDPALGRERQTTEAHAWRLDAGRAAAAAGPLDWHDERRGVVVADPFSLGDAVIARKDAATSYHLAVVVDDALQGVTDVVRGEDLFTATHLHRVLQALLDLRTPRYHHHRLLLGADGRRLAKRAGAETLAALRANGVASRDVRAGLGFA